MSKSVCMCTHKLQEQKGSLKPDFFSNGHIAETVRYSFAFFSHSSLRNRDAFHTSTHRKPGQESTQSNWYTILSSVSSPHERTRFQHWPLATFFLFSQSKVCKRSNSRQVVPGSFSSTMRGDIQDIPNQQCSRSEMDPTDSTLFARILPVSETVGNSSFLESQFVFFGVEHHENSTVSTLSGDASM